MATAKRDLTDHSVQGHSKLLTVTEAAEHLAVSTKTLYRLRSAGEIAFIKVGGSIRFRQDDLNEFEARQRVAANRYAHTQVDAPARLNLVFEVKKRGRGPRRS